MTRAPIAPTAADAPLAQTRLEAARRTTAPLTRMTPKKNADPEAICAMNQDILGPNPIGDSGRLMCRDDTAPSNDRPRICSPVAQVLTGSTEIFSKFTPDCSDNRLVWEFRLGMWEMRTCC